MRRLDLIKDKGNYGTIQGVHQPDDFDRPALYHQSIDGAYVFYDQHGREIVPGKPLQQIVPQVAAEADRTVTPMSLAELVAQADKMPWPELKRRAAAALGKDCPAGKAGIIATLTEALAGQEARQAKRSPGLTWSQMAGQDEIRVAINPADTLVPADPDAMPRNAPKPATGSVDLAAWGRGQKQYLFGEVRKAIRAQHNRAINGGPAEKRDAVDFLIEAGVITAAEARQDVR